MANGKVVIFLAINLATFITGFPQTPKDGEQQTQGISLPFLKFGNGGISVRFGPWQAGAGLGGGPSGGGLWANAGMDGGPGAAAGLGGGVNGDATAGGLRAEATAGKGGPHAAAGLGGFVNSDSDTPTAGGLFAVASPGGYTKTKTSHVQVISPKRNQDGKEVTVRREAGDESADGTVGVGLYGAVHADENGAVKSIDKIKISNGKVDIVDQGSAPVPSSSSAVNPTVDSSATGDIVGEKKISVVLQETTTSIQEKRHL